MMWSLGSLDLQHSLPPGLAAHVVAPAPEHGPLPFPRLAEQEEARQRHGVNPPCKMLRLALHKVLAVRAFGRGGVRLHQGQRTSKLGPRHLAVGTASLAVVVHEILRVRVEGAPGRALQITEALRVAQAAVRDVRGLAVPDFHQLARARRYAGAQ
eukprot:6413190-Pyramimonas_sp.AAC.1